jgi:selenocysteine-specific elongation factor
MQTYPIILGTAGHIDHGKTSLVRALTGIETDRLKEEQERGITIELGFAHLDVDGRRFGLVDVPGHERFLKAMVAGAGGVDVVMLVIAGDEGVMPQTREHLDICELLGIKRGVIALTKRDLVDPQWLELVTSDVRTAVEKTFLAGAKIIPVSSVSGAGLDDLRAELVRLAGEVPARSPAGLFRLPLDRIFSMKGFGTVVTGTILGGRVKIGDDVVALPSERAAKVRGLQVHGEAVEEARAGMRCAVNLAGVDRDDLPRGEILSHPGALAPTHLLDARLRYLRTSKQPLGRRARALLHHATAQIMATIVLVDRDELAPGDEALVQLHLDTAVAALPGDHFIARGFVPQEHYGTTIGGGEILRVHAPKVRRSSEEAAASLRKVAGAAPIERTALEIRGAGPVGMARATLGSRLGLAPAAIDDALNRLVQQGDLLREGDHYLHAEPLARLEQTALAAVDAFHVAQPHKEGISREELRSKLPRALPPRLYDAILKQLERRQAIVAEKDVVRRARHTSQQRESVAGTDALGETIAARFVRWGLEAPRPQDVPAEVKQPEPAVRAALDVLLRKGRLVRVKPDYYVDKGALDALREKLKSFLAEHGQITAQEWKAMTGATRKWAIPLAEHFDAEKLTLRVGEVRKLRGK